MGLGSTAPLPRSASARARFIQARSEVLTPGNPQGNFGPIRKVMKRAPSAFGAVDSFFGAAGTGGGGVGPRLEAAEPVDTDVPGRAGLNSSLGKSSR